MPEQYVVNEQDGFQEELRTLINCHSKENGSNTPDFILAKYLVGCLEAFDVAVNRRRISEVSASEALFGFVGWITTRKESIAAGSSNDCAVWADLVAKFCDKQGLAKPREKWGYLLLPMKEAGIE